MRKKVGWKKYLFLWLLILFMGQLVYAGGSYGEVLSWTKLGAGTRAFGLGGAYAAIAEGPDAVFYNPAGLAQSQKREFTSMYSIMKLDQKLNWNSYLHPLGHGQAVAGSWFRYYMDKIEKRDNSGNLEGYIDNTENIFIGSYALRANSHLSLGVNFNYLEHKVDSYNANAFSFDAGFLYSWKYLKLGGVIKNMGGEYDWNNSNDTKEEIPLTGIFGVAYYPLKDWLVTADVEKRTDVKAIYRAGIEYWPYSSTALRIGVNDGELSWGATFKMYGWQFDYGYEDSNLGELHRVAVTMVFE